MEGNRYSLPSTFEQVFYDYKGRRAGLIKALTIDVDKFYQQCSPEDDNLCLFGHPNESWEVNLPAEEVPTELPEPVLGINFARDGMMKEDWLSLVAVHSDSWLLSVVFYNGTRVGFKKTERDQIFNMISDLPTVFEVLSESSEQAKEQKSNKKRSRNGSKSQEYEPVDKISNKSGHEDTKGNKDEEDEEQDATCGVCGEIDSSDEFWIMCDTCERWFHGQCVKITPAKAKNMKDYECPDCHNIKARV